MQAPLRSLRFALPFLAAGCAAAVNPPASPATASSVAIPDQPRPMDDTTCETLLARAAVGLALLALGRL